MWRFGVFFAEARGGFAKEFRQAVCRKINLRERGPGIECLCVILNFTVG
jgi:hypothetical protein